MKNTSSITFNITTPCYNAAHYLEETIRSVINQNAVRSGKVKLNYWIIDGGSTDSTISIIKKYEHHGINYISEKDAGMYDALSKGLRKAKDGICCYINAGDYFHPAAFDVVADVFADPSIKWLTGYNVQYNEKSQITDIYLPKRYFNKFMLRGIYGQVRPHVQQESTFWRSELLAYLDFDKLKSFRYAGDYYLWHCFAQHAELNVVASHLGGFKVHEGQLSAALERYTRELQSISNRKLSATDRVLAFLDKIIERLPSKFLLIPLGYDKAIRWNPDSQSWSQQ